MRKTFLCVCALLLWLPQGVWGQSLPRQVEFYFDEDESVARAITAVNGSDEQAITQLVRMMERGGRNSERAVAQLAHLSMNTGRIDNGKALYERALGQVGAGSQIGFSIAWNYGWDLYRIGEIDAAIQQWQRAFATRVVKPAWVPPTLALALWKLDRKSEAVEWYAAAVRTYPDQWSNPAALPNLLPGWSEADRAVLRDVLAAWRANPPAWP